MSYSHRVWIYGPVAALLLFIAGYCAFWYYATNEVSDWLDRANGRASSVRYVKFPVSSC